MDDQLARGGIMLQSFDVASLLFDDMIKINQDWYNQDDQVSPFCFRMTKEQVYKEKGRYENIEKNLSQMELLQAQALGNVKNPKGTRGIFRVKEVSFSSYLKPRILKV